MPLEHRREPVERLDGVVVVIRRLERGARVVLPPADVRKAVPAGADTGCLVLDHDRVLAALVDTRLDHQLRRTARQRAGTGPPLAQAAGDAACSVVADARAAPV